MSSPVVAAFEAVRSDPALLSHASQAANAAHPRKSEVLPHDEVRRHIDVLLDALISMVDGGADPERTAAADGLARDRAAQGVSLESLLAGFQAARSHLLDSLLRHLNGAVTPDELGPMLTVLDNAVGNLQNSMILAHQDAEKSLGRMRGALRLEALRTLLDTGEPAAARDLGLHPELRFLCVVAAVSAPREAREIEPLLAGGDGVTGLVRGYLCRVTTRPPRPAAGLDEVLVMVSPPVDVADLPAAHAACLHAIEIARARGDVGLRSMTDYAVDIAVDGHGLLAQFLVDVLLADLDHTDAFHRQLAETGYAYLCHGRRVDATAAALHVHPNTITHRLRRLGDLTGFAVVQDGPESFAATCRWWWALRTWLAT